MFLFLFYFSSSALLFQKYEEKSFLNWMRTTNQFYTGQDYHLRFGIYLQNLRLVKMHNSNPDNPFKVSLNQFAALTPSEYKQMLGFKPKSSYFNDSKKIRKEINHKTTANLDWRDKGVVNTIKNQYLCGSCWAFSAIQAAESAYAISTGTLLSFSEQNLVDCVTLCHGCSGGLMTDAYNYVINHQGGKFNTESEYWYVSFQESCYFDKYEKVGSISDYIKISKGDEDDLAIKIETYGPAAVAVDASSVWFQLYFSGIYDNSDCSSSNLDHGVGCVGFGEESGTRYWIVRNSWGSLWGENGYIRMIRKDNQCGIASWSCIPVP